MNTDTLKITERIFLKKIMISPTIYYVFYKIYKAYSCNKAFLSEHMYLVFGKSHYLTFLN